MPSLALGTACFREEHVSLVSCLFCWKAFSWKLSGGVSWTPLGGVFEETVEMRFLGNRWGAFLGHRWEVFSWKPLGGVFLEKCSPHGFCHGVVWLRFSHVFCLLPRAKKVEYYFEGRGV